MQDFLVTVTVYAESDGHPLSDDGLREKMASLGLRDYLVNDANEWIALPENVYAAWAEGSDSDATIEEWRAKLGGPFGGAHMPGQFFVTVGSAAVWMAQLFSMKNDVSGVEVRPEVKFSHWPGRPAPAPSEVTTRWKSVLLM